MFFPDQKVDKPEKWTPLYSVEVIRQSGMQTEQMTIPELTQDECPVSILSRHPRSIFLLAEVTSAMAVQETTGSFAFGPDSGKWHCRWYDMVSMVNSEDSRVEAERNKVRESK